MDKKQKSSLRTCFELLSKAQNSTADEKRSSTSHNHLCAVLKLAVFRDSFSFGHIFEIGRYNLVPFVDLIGIYTNNKLMFWRLFLGNLGWFVPLGVFLRYKFRNLSLAGIAIIGFCLSLCIEISQFVFKCGVFELDDIILNTTGSFLGAWTLNLVLKFSCFNAKNSSLH